MSSEKVSVKTDRFYSAHHTLKRIAEYNLAEAEETKCFDCQFTAIAMSSLTIEAFCNAVGEKNIQNWKDFESCSPIAKIRLLCEHLEITYDSRAELWASIIWLSKMRNRIAHPKAEPLTRTDEMTRDKNKKQTIPDIPKSKLEKEVTLGNARRAVTAVSQMIDLFCKKLTPGQNFGVIGDGFRSNAWSHKVNN